MTRKENLNHSAQRFRVIPRSLMARTNPADVVHFYYWPIVGALFRRRCQMLLDVIAGRRYKKMLEVAYGSGVMLPSLAPLADELYAIDLHNKHEPVEKMLGALSIKAELSTGDALDMPYENDTFDCVVSLSMVEHLRDPGAAIDEMLRVAKPGGVLGLGFPVRNPWMDLGIRMFGFDTRKIHPSSHRDILRALSKRGQVENLLKMPRFLPVDLCLFTCCTLTKGR